MPSFYALDVMRAVTGTLPSHEDLARAAAAASGARLAWPAPRDPREAIDDLEHDLAVLAGLFRQEGKSAAGHAHYLLKLNPFLRLSVHRPLEPLASPMVAPRRHRPRHGCHTARCWPSDG